MCLDAELLIIPKETKLTECVLVFRSIGRQTNERNEEMKTTTVAIPGCAHTQERMTEWCQQGACPICLTAALGMANDARAELEQRVKELEKDKARLDWLNLQRVEVHYGDGLGEHFIQPLIHKYTIRQAIDAKKGE